MQLLALLLGGSVVLFTIVYSYYLWRLCSAPREQGPPAEQIPLVSVSTPVLEAAVDDLVEVHSDQKGHG